jgi:hypothetical protein
MVIHPMTSTPKWGRSVFILVVLEGVIEGWSLGAWICYS